jgi:hypothetical protein
MMRVSQIFRSLPLAGAAVLALIFAPAAAADNSQSANWAGYAVHHTNVNFKKVLGTWTQPKAVCTPGQATYSSVWIGIGGYSVSSNALEQIGTEADCTAAGRQASSAWYELVPAASATVKIPVNAGDRMRAGVSISGSEVTLTLNNLTRHRTFTKRLHASVLDTTSAEWIVEAPSVCISTGCQTLPLADFGSTGFSAASAKTTAGHTGTIDDRRWTTTKITLAEGGRQFFAGAGAGAPFATATPSPLTGKDSAFTVTYSGLSSGFSPSQAKRVTAARIVHAPALSPSS